LRRLYDLLPEAERAGIGHNGGPPLDLSYKAWAWRKAHAKAWESPGREIVMLRLRGAHRLGLSYEAYTSVILDRGARLEGVIVLLNAVWVTEAITKLAQLNDCCLMLCAKDDVTIPASLCARAAHIARFTSADAVIAQLLMSSRLAPSSVFMVGPENVRRAAEQARLGLFLDEKVYFGGGQ
jgi:hypothetical protein